VDAKFLVLDSIPMHCIYCVQLLIVSGLTSTAMAGNEIGG